MIWPPKVKLCLPFTHWRLSWMTSEAGISANPVFPCAHPVGELGPTKVAIGKMSVNCPLGSPVSPSLAAHPPPAVGLSLIEETRKKFTPNRLSNFGVMTWVSLTCAMYWMACDVRALLYGTGRIVPRESGTLELLENRKEARFPWVISASTLAR